MKIINLINNKTTDFVNMKFTSFMGANMIKYYNKLFYSIINGKALILVFVLLMLVSFVNGTETSSYKYTGNLVSTSTGVISSTYSYPQTYSPSFSNYYTSSQISTYWPVFSDKTACQSRQDFMIQILPGGCSPMVVRSDLLAEQDVPVFCQLSAIKLNPAIDVSGIDSIGFKGKYPDAVSGVSFHPARAAIRTSGSQLLGSPLVNNIGYVVILLKRNEIEANLSKFVAGNLTATISYDIKKAFGVGNSEFILKEMSDEEWQRDYVKYGFWSGKGYLRLESLYNNQAIVGIYKDATNKYSTVTLDLGKTSNDVYLPSSYCQVALNFNLKSINAPKTSARLIISGNKDEEVEVYKGSKFLDNACSVQDIVKDTVGGSVKINCNFKTYTLNIGSANNFVVSVDGTDSTLKLWDDIGGYKVAYYVDAGKKSSIQESFIVLVKPSTQLPNDKEKASIVSSIKSAVDGITFATAKDYADNVATKLKPGISISPPLIQDTIILYKGEIYGKQLPDGRNVIFKGAEIKDTSYGDNTELELYYKNAIDSYEKLVNSYPSDRETTEEISYGEKGIINAIQLSLEVGKGKNAFSLINLAKSVYSGKEAARFAAQKEASVLSIGLNNSVGFYLGTSFYFVQLAEINSPTAEEAGAYATLESTSETGTTELLKDERFGVGSYIYDEQSKQYSTSTSNPALKSQCLEFIRLDDLKNDTAIVSYRAITYARGIGSCDSSERTATLKLGTITTLGRFRLNIREINLNQVASVALSPKIMGSTGDVNFSYKIGIEKRDIQLAPKQINEKIKNLNESIKKWNDINMRLGNLVSGLKAACLATSAYVVAKNLVSDFAGISSGEALARNSVMRGSGGWVEKCNAEIAKDSSLNMDRCLSKHSSEINDDVSKLADIMDKQNEALKTSWEGVDSNSNLFDDLTKENVVNSKAAALKYYSNAGYKSTIDTALSNADVESLINDGTIGIDDLRDIVTAQKEIDEGGTLADLGRATMKSKDSYFKDLAEAAKNQDSFASTLKDKGVNTDLLNERNSQILSAVGTNRPYVSPITLDANNAPKLNVNLRAGDKVIFYTIPGSLLSQISDTGVVRAPGTGSKRVVVKLTQQGAQGSEYIWDKAYSLDKVDDDGGQTTRELNFALKEAGIGGFKQASPEQCKNNYQKPMVHFYESGQSKGDPAIVPVDIVNGWYAATKQTLGTFGDIKAYTEAKQLQSFYLCNVGKNMMEEFNSGGRDDICTMINLQTGQPTNEIGCVSKAEATRLVNAAIKNLYSAAEQYGKTSIVIDGKAYKVGEPKANVPSTQCQDFMSPQDCNKLFNVCDPVICPSSRCNLGGDYTVPDVVQSGIVGSLVLCLPNFGWPSKGGVIIPVCLSGLYAGIQAYVSILESARDCLQANLDDGKMIGICDEVTSIYTCNFFWGQIAPIMKAILPKIISYAAGQGTRGGGEYTTVTAAWNNAESSINYMKDVYGANAYKAFQARSITDVGTEFCNGFVGTSFPTDLKAFTEPDSPVQFTAYFSADIFSEATVPSTSHYKVYYHIYAGTDQGTSYQVYLKDPPTTSYYSQNPMLVVDTGYIGKGESVDETKDTTAPSGYRSLCVNINGQEKCGFGQVSSSFAINYANSAYMASQASQTDINSEADCISGTSSAYSLLQPNLQSAANDIVNPAIYEKGIIRMCSTVDPGFSTDAGLNMTDRRWQKVGWCEKQNNIACWVDTNSVKDVIKSQSMLNDTLNNIYTNVKDAAVASGEGMDPTATQTTLSTIGNEKSGDYALFLQEVESAQKAKSRSQLKEAYDKAIGVGGVIANLDDVINKGYYNIQKAQALLLKAGAYAKLTRAALGILTAGAGATAASDKVKIDTSYVTLNDGNYYNGGNSVYDANGNYVRDANDGDRKFYGLSPISGNLATLKTITNSVKYQVFIGDTGTDLYISKLGAGWVVSQVISNKEYAVGEVDNSGKIVFNEIDASGLTDNMKIMQGYTFDSKTFALEKVGAADAQSLNRVYQANLNTIDAPSSETSITPLLFDKIVLKSNSNTPYITIKEGETTGEHTFNGKVIYNNLNNQEGIGVSNNAKVDITSSRGLNSVEFHYLDGNQNERWSDDYVNKKYISIRPWLQSNDKYLKIVMKSNDAQGNQYTEEILLKISVSEEVDATNSVADVLAEQGIYDTSIRTDTQGTTPQIACPIDNIIFEFMSGRVETGVVSFKFSSQWAYSLDRGNSWFNTGYLSPDLNDYDKKFLQDNFADSSVRESASEGLSKLVIRTEQSNEGAWIFNDLLSTKIPWIELDHNGNFKKCAAGSSTGTAQDCSQVYNYESLGSWTLNGNRVSSNSLLYGKDSTAGECLIFSGKV